MPFHPTALRWLGPPGTIQRRVQWLALACLLPSWALAVVMSWLSYEDERAQAIGRSELAARSLMFTVERELDAGLAVLQTLAAAPDIDHRAYERLLVRAVEAQQRLSAFNVFLVDRQLRILMVATPAGAAASPILLQDRFPQVMASGRSEVSDLFVGRFVEKSLVSLAVPVMRDGQAIGRMEMVIEPLRFTRLLQLEPLPPGWTVRLTDRQGRIVAALQAGQPSAMVRTGSAAPEPVSAALRASVDVRVGHLRHTDAAGAEVLSSFARSERHGWALAVEVPLSQSRADLARSLAVYSAGALLLLAAGLVLTTWVARRIAQPLQSLVVPALAIGRGEPAAIEPGALEETHVLGQALQRTQQLLHERDQARQAAEASLRESQARLRIALDACLIGDWDLDVRSGQMQHSLRHDQCFGYEQAAAEWTTGSFLKHVHPDDVDEVRHSLQQWRNEGGRWRRDVRVIWPDGSEHWLICACSALVENGELAHLVGIVVDITDRKQREVLRAHALRLEADNRQIQQSHRIKSEFLANMSHELRTPLNAVIGFAEILKSGAVEPQLPQAQQFLGHISASGQHLLQLINEVLDLSKVESGSFEFSPQPLDLGRLVHEVVGVLHNAAERKNIDVRAEVDPGLGELVLDPARLKQVLYNLLSNAIKFTGVGGRVSLHATPADAGRVRIEIEDNGIGIAEVDQAKLFMPFQQIDAGTDRLRQGTGLGLALTRRLVEGQGGSIALRSRPGEGSTFQVLLPRRASPLDGLADAGSPALET